MASEKLSALTSLAGGQVPTDLAYVVDVSAGTSGSKKSTLDDLFAEITKNITDGALRFAGFAAPTVSAAGKGALYFSTADNTFKGSRNAGAYENLIFGSGGNTRVTVWSTGADQITGFAEFIYQPTGSGVGNKVVRLTVSGSAQDAQFYADNTFASTPSSAGLTNLGALNLTRLTTGSFPIITMNQGRSGPAYPQSLDVLGVMRWRSTNNSTFNEAAYIQVLAGQNHSGSASGSGMEIWTTPLSTATAVRRIMIGAGPVGQTIVFNADPANTLSTDFGTNTRFAIRTPTTNDNLAQVIISGASSTTLKELVLQAGISQTANIFECQDSAGTVLYSISAAGVPSASGTITVGTTPISGGTTTRVLYDNAGVIGEYVITGTGNVVMSANPTFTGVVSFADGSVSAPSITFADDTDTGIYSLVNEVLAITTAGSASASFAATGVYIGGAAQFPDAQLHVISGANNRPAALFRSGDTPTSDIIQVKQKIGVNEYSIFLIKNYGELYSASRPRTGSAPVYVQLLTPADTSLTASTESIGAQFGGDASQATVTRQFATGALTTQRENVFVAPTYAFAGASTLTNAATVAITGAPAQGTNATITNSYALWIQSGTAKFDPAVTTGTGTTAGLQLTANSLTTGNGAEFSSSSVTSGNVFSLASTSTAAASNTQTVLNVATSGANSTATQTTYASQFSNTHTGTSSTNIAVSGSASGGASGNYAFYAAAGNVHVVTGGTVSSPAFVLSNGSKGIYEGSSSNNNLMFKTGNNVAVAFLFNGGVPAVNIRAGAFYGISSSSTDSEVAADVLLTRRAAANWNLGATDAAAAIAQILSVQSVITGTSNTAGANWTRKGSAGTGTGVGGDHIWQVAPAGSAGTTQNSFVEAMRIAGSGAIIFPSTVTSGGTTGDQTINKVSGTVNFAAAATTLTVTNSLVTTSSLVFCVVRTNDGTATIKNVVPGSGSFVITLAAAATAETSVGFFVINQ